jgi:hypothetical protein
MVAVTSVSAECSQTPMHSRREAGGERSAPKDCRRGGVLSGGHAAAQGCMGHAVSWGCREVGHRTSRLDMEHQDTTSSKLEVKG